MMEGSPGCCRGTASIADWVWDLWGHGAAGHEDPQGTARSSRARLKSYSPAQLPAGMPGWAPAGYPHTRLRCSAPRGAAFLWHQQACPQGPSTCSPSQARAGDLWGTRPAGCFSSRPRRVSLQGGGRLLWHDLRALPLSAWGRNQVPCSTIAVLSWQDQAQPHSSNADGNNLPRAQAGRAMLTLPRKGRHTHQQWGKPCSYGVRDWIRPSAPDTHSPDPACQQHQGLGLEPALPPHPSSLPCTPFIWKGAFPT